MYFFAILTTKPQIGLDQLRLPALDLFFGKIEMLDGILDLFGRNQRFFGLQLTNPSLWRFDKASESPPAASSDTPVFRLTAKNPAGSGTSSSAVPRRLLPHTQSAVGSWPLPVRPCGSADRQIADTLDHPIFQHAMQIDRFHFVHNLLADRIELLFELLLLTRISAEMACLLSQSFSASGDLPHGIQ